MLKQINIKNLAIIEDVELSFSNDFTALTGATGAGKSLLIDSLKLIFGKRADNDLIRYNEEEATITAVFKRLNTQVKDYLSLMDIEGDEIIIERVLSRNKQNKILINNQPKTLNDLRMLGLLLGDIHEQHDTTKLLDPETALEILDSYGDSSKVINEYVTLKFTYDEILKRLNQAKSQTKENDELLDLYKYQYDELKKSKLNVNEKTELEEIISTLTHQTEILLNLQSSYEGINALDDQNILYTSIQSLDKISTYHPNYLKLKERLDGIYYELSDIKESLFQEIDVLRDISVDELDYYQERYYFLEDLEKKYNKSIEELITYIQTLEEEILKRENFDLFIENLIKEKEKAFHNVYEKGLELSKIRKDFAKKLESDFVKHLRKLDIDYVDFKVHFNDNSLKTLYENGLDDVIFLISLNEGEPLKSFHKVASGGELSRSMLALKMLYGKSHDLGLMVFDEIDLGISGDAATKVAKSLKELSKERQIIVITHLPQVASKADIHYHIMKKVENKRTTTVIENLEGDSRLYRLAYMLSGKNLTEGALMHAKSLLEQ